MSLENLIEQIFPAPSHKNDLGSAPDKLRTLASLPVAIVTKAAYTSPSPGRECRAL